MPSSPGSAIPRVLSWVRPSLITLALLALVALGFEVGLRARPAPEGARFSPVIPPDPELLWANRPGPLQGLGVDTHINACGLRSPEVPADRAPGTRRVLLTGDSSVFGVMVPDEEVVSSALARRLGPGVEVYNGGTPGYSTEQSLRQVRRCLDEVRPDLLLVANLWSDNNFDAFVDADELARVASPGHRWGLRAGAFLARSALVSALFGLGDAGEREIGWGLVGRGAALGVRRVDLERYTANLDAFVALAAEVGARTAFVILANTEDLERPERAWPWHPYREVMREAAHRHRVPAVDLPRAFRTSGQPPEALFLDEMHPSPQGHALMAEAIAAALEGWGWVDGEPTPPPAVLDPPRQVHDPWVEPWVAGQATQPAIVGVITSADYDVRAAIEAVEGPAPGTVVDRVSLPGPAPFALAVRPPRQVWLRVKVRPKRGAGEERTISFEGTPLALAEPAWGVRVDLDAGRVDLP